MSRNGSRVSLMGVAGALLLLPGVSTLASASQLEVDAGVLQAWTFTDQLPDIPAPVLPDLAACGASGGYVGVLYAEPGVELIAPEPPAGTSKGWILVGTEGDDVLTVGNKTDCLVGLGGNDNLSGHQGKDILLGGAGADVLDGGQGKDDLFPGGDPGDACVNLEQNESCVGVPAANLSTQYVEPAPAPQEPADPEEKAQPQPAPEPNPDPAPEPVPVAPAPAEAQPAQGPGEQVDAEVEGP